MKKLKPREAKLPRFQTHFLSFALPQRTYRKTPSAPFLSIILHMEDQETLLVQYYHQGVHSVMYNSAERRFKGAI